MPLELNNQGIESGQLFIYIHLSVIVFWGEMVVRFFTMNGCLRPQTVSQ